MTAAELAAHAALARCLSKVEVRQRKDRDAIVGLDTDVFTDFIRDVVLAYQIDGNDPNYPRVTVHTAKAPYSKNQYDVLVRMMDGVMDQSTLEYFLEGDMSRKLFENPKFMTDMDASDFEKEVVSVGNMRAGGEWPPKFPLVVKKMGQRSVVWSNHTRDIRCFEAFLAANHPSMTREMIWSRMSSQEVSAVLERFKAGKISVLLLHPSMYQGISIMGATDLHILEPNTDVLKIDQVIGRVRRYASHAHLPPAQRKVKVYKWMCEYKMVWGTNLMDAALKKYVREYKPHLTSVMPDLKHDFRRTSPDQIIMEMSSKSDADLADIVQKLKAKGATCADKPLQCCPWDPDEGRMNGCVSQQGVARCDGQGR